MPSRIIICIHLTFASEGEEVRRLWCQHGQDHGTRQARGNRLLQDQGAALQGWVRTLSRTFTIAYRHHAGKQKRAEHAWRQPPGQGGLSLGLSLR